MSNLKSSVPLRLLAALAALALLAASCGSDDADSGDDATDAADAVDASSDTSDPSTDDAASGDEGSDDTTADTSTDDSSDTTTGDSSDDTSDDDTDDGGTGDSDGGTTLPGDAWDGFAQPGDSLAVIGVAFDDVLNVRSIPGTNGEILTTVAPDGSVTATGEARLLPESAWYEVEVGGVTGWAALAFLGYPGVVDDATAEFSDVNGLPTYPTLPELGEAVSEAFASFDPPSDIVQVGPADPGSDSALAEVIYDVVGMGDDALTGYRLHIFANPTDDGFSLKSIERQALCTRGLSGELCA